MNIKRVILTIVVVLIGASIYQFFFSPGAQVNRTIKQAKEAIEKGDIERCMQAVSPRYRDSYGYDHKGLKQVLSATFKSGSTNIFIIRQKKKFLPLEQCEVFMLIIINASSAEYGAVRGREFIRLLLVREPDKVYRCLKAELLERDPFEPQGLTPKETL